MYAAKMSPPLPGAPKQEADTQGETNERAIRRENATDGVTRAIIITLSSDPSFLMFFAHS